MGTSDLIAAIALGASVIGWIASLAISNRRHDDAIRRSDEANAIARQALDLERSRAAKEDFVTIQPVRYDPVRPGVLYEVMSAGPVAEVIFEFRNYADFGGAHRRVNVPPGERWVTLGDFDEPGGLPDPPSRVFYAKVRWKRTAGADWDESGVYAASKDRYSFRHI